MAKCRQVKYTVDIYSCNGQLATFLGSIYRSLDPKEFDKEGKEKEEGEAYRPS